MNIVQLKRMGQDPASAQLPNTLGKVIINQFAGEARSSYNTVAPVTTTQPPRFCPQLGSLGFGGFRAGKCHPTPHR